MSAAEPGNGHDRAQEAAFRMLAHSLLTGRIDFARRHGFQFEGDRDLYTALGYTRGIRLRDMRERYERGGIARRIVDAKPQATWREAPEVVENPDTQRQTAFERAWDGLVRRTPIWEYLERVDKLAGLGTYAVLLLGLNDGRPLEREAGRVRGSEGLLFFQPYAEEHATIERLDEDPTSPRFGLPLLYKIQVGAEAQGKAGRRTQPALAHWSRVLHVADGLLESDVYGTPRLKPVWNLLDDLIKVGGGSAEMFWRGGYQGIQAAIDPKAELSPADESALDDELKEWEHRLRRFIRTRSVELKPLETQVSDPRGAFQVVAQQIAGVTEIPMRILFGSERGEMASTQDRHNWNERIAERQRSYAEPRVLRPLIERLQRVGALPAAARNRSVQIEWPDLLATPESERAQISQRRGQAIAAYDNARAKAAQWGIAPTVPPREFREQVLELPAEPPEGSREPAPDPSEAT